MICCHGNASLLGEGSGPYQSHGFSFFVSSQSVFCSVLGYAFHAVSLPVSCLAEPTWGKGLSDTVESAQMIIRTFPQVKGFTPLYVDSKRGGLEEQLK